MNINQLLILVLCSVLFYGYLEYRARTADSPAYAQRYMADESVSEEEKRAELNAGFYFILFLTAFPLLIGLVNINQWFRAYNLAVDSQNWLKIDGVLTKKYVAASTEHRSSSSSSIQTSTYSPQAEYQFEYQGKLYQSQGIDFKNGFSYGDPGYAEKQLSKLPDVGEAVAIFFDENSKRTVLNPGSKGTNYIPLILVSLVWVLGIFMLRFAFSLILV